MKSIHKKENTQTGTRGGGGSLKVNLFCCHFFLVDCYCFYPDECASPIYYRKKNTITIC